MLQTIHFPSGSVDYYFNNSIDELSKITNKKIILLTDNHIWELHKSKIEQFPSIIIPVGEDNKNLATLQTIIDQLIKYEADRNTILVGVGGGVVTDICGFAASIYMRGIDFGFIPTSILAMADAGIGGKNGINFGVYKNMLGCFNQPKFILFDYSFLKTLPNKEWSNGFAEIIKYACIVDAELFKMLSEKDIDFFQQNEDAVSKVIERCAAWKNKIVLEDEKEKGKRKLLNFGHTAGHAIEKKYQLAHGEAISIGMIVACIVSEKTVGLEKNIQVQIKNILRKYSLPTGIKLDISKIMSILKMDKKRNNDQIDFIVLNEIGESSIQRIYFEKIEEALIIFNNECNN